LSVADAHVFVLAKNPFS